MRIESEDPARRAEEQAAAERLGLCMVEALDAEPADVRLILAMRDEGWELRDAAMKPGCGVRIDFTSFAAASARRGNISRRHPLARAVGRESRCVIDATAGLGRDTSLLATMGLEVVAIERHAVLALMLEEALTRALNDPATAPLFGERLRIIHGDARDLLSTGKHRADCIYLDPMYPPKRRESALAKKEIRLVRALVGEDLDAADLLATARRHAARVVVKRPHHAAPLAEDVHATIASNLVRYDIYRGSASCAG